jgi:penicillin amidase
VTVDANRHQAIVLRSTGDEPGSSFLSNLSLDRMANARDSPLVHHKMPAENCVYAKVEGNIGYQDSGLRDPEGVTGFATSARMDVGSTNGVAGSRSTTCPHAENPASGWLATANNNVVPPEEIKPIGYEWLEPRASTESAKCSVPAIVRHRCLRAPAA